MSGIFEESIDTSRLYLAMRLLVFRVNPMQCINVGFKYCIVLSFGVWDFVSYFFIYSLVM